MDALFLKLSNSDKNSNIGQIFSPTKIGILLENLK